MLRSILKLAAGAVDIVQRLLGMKERRDQREIGATMQREADQKGTIHAQRDQLKKAANRKRGDARRRLRRGDF